MEAEALRVPHSEPRKVIKKKASFAGFKGIKKVSMK